MTCGFDRTSFSIRVFDNSKVPSNAEAFLTFEIVNECFTPPSPGGVPLADLPAYVTGMKFFRPTTGTDDYQLYGFNADGTGEGRVTDNAFRDRAPEWSPDGTRLSFSSNRNGTSQDNYDLYVAEGTLDNVQRLTDLGMTGSSAPRRHAWSPDGTRICFVAGRDLYVIDAAPGKTPVQLTQGPEGDDQPTWSQDSSRIAFVRDLALWIMDADGGNAQMVLDDVFFAAWSPHAADGRRVAVQRGTGMFILEPDDSLTPWGDNTAAIADTLLWTTEDGLVSLYGGELWFIGETSTQVVDLDIDPLADTEGLTRR